MPISFYMLIIIKILYYLFNFSGDEFVVDAKHMLWKHFENISLVRKNLVRLFKYIKCVRSYDICPSTLIQLLDNLIGFLI